jgi:DNA repair protein RecN (Recombination protein N)
LLAELKIKSFGIIDQLDWSLAEGLCMVTGETGAGKSLLIEAVAALLEGRIDEEHIRHGAEAARIEAVFFLNPQTAARLKPLLAEKGLEVEEEALVLSCEFRRVGRVVLRLNGSAVPRALVREIGHLLLDMHGQSEHLSLFDTKNHLGYLDAYAHLWEKRESFAAGAVELCRLEAELRSLEEAAKDRAHRREVLQFQIDEISRSKLFDGEDESLERERLVASSSEKLKALSYEAYQALEGEEEAEPAIPRISKGQEALRRLTSIDDSLKPALETIEAALANLQEVARDLHRYADGLDYDPARLEEIQDRLELLRTLKKKYGGSIPQIQAYQARAAEELAALENQDELKSGLENGRLKLKLELGNKAVELSKLRKQAAQRLQKEVEKELSELALSQVKFKIGFGHTLAEAGIPVGDGQNLAFTKEGIDQVEFLVTTNPGEPLKPLAVIASTGEVSRFTLALKVALAEADQTPVLIFDEIDIGVGGRSGEVIGRKLWELSRHHQVICVTHLPQIAVYGGAHYSVQKDTSGTRTTSSVAVLTGDKRFEELALMLGGTRGGDTSARDAREMAARATQWIKGKASTT